MDFEPDKILEILKKLFEVAGVHPPLWLTRTFAWAVLLAVLLCAVWGILYVLSKIKELATEFVPPQLNRETRQRLARRRRFAEHIENEVRRLNNEQSWSDYRFTELEAEVEAEGRRRALPFLPLLLPRTTSGLRREKSLTKAIDVSRERLILIEGDPGSGKSVAFRHVTMKLASRARRKGLQTVIPLYVNLKELDRSQDRAIDRNLIQEFVLKTLNRVNDRDVEEFLDKEFGKGLEVGGWLFLFDSFDEMPEILGSTEPDAVIRQYTRAIEDFLHGMNRCRGVIASRYFRGPGQVQWPRFRILPLSSERRQELVKRADLQPAIERELLGRLPVAIQQMGLMISNPLFLGLICEHMKNGHTFPENSHAVFESYIEQRLSRDAERIDRRFGLKPTPVRRVAEQVAFCMAADPSLGLSPSRERIPMAMVRAGFEVTSILFTCLDALEFIKLCRAESAVGGSERLFTFAHRRFQEYFATCLVLSSPGRVSARRLLLDGRWRETAIVICQTAPFKSFAPLLEEVRHFLAPLNLSEESDHIADFPWPRGLLHVLSVLQEGFAARMQDLPLDIRLQAGRVVSAVTETGTLVDRKWALEVCGCVDGSTLIYVVKRAFASKSRWLAEVAYRQAGRLPEIAQDLYGDILGELVRFFVRGHFWRERHATSAHLARLERHQRFRPSFRLLLSIPFVDLALHLLILLYAFSRGGYLWLIFGVVLFLSLNILRSFRPFFEARANPVVVFGAIRISLVPLLCLALRTFLGCSIVTVSLLWVPSALWAAKEGRFVEIFWWPFLPLLGPAVSASRVRLWELLEPAIPLTLLMGTLMGLALTLKSFFAIVLGLLLVVCLATLVGLCWEFLGGLGILIQGPKMLKEDEFCANLERLALPQFRALYIRRVRERALLEPSRVTELRLAALALEVELRLLRFSSDWNPEALDELCRLRESLRTEPPTTALSTEEIDGAA